MSTGTNRERIEQNNTLLEGIKTQIQNLPEAGGSGDIKLFETKEAMQADTTAKEGDLAVVYRSEVRNVTVDSRFQIATFPDTVVLDTAITDYVEVRYRAVDESVMFDCWGSLDSSMFEMDCRTETGEIRIQYTSSDGITYTRTDTTGNPVDFGTEIYYEMPEMWNDAIGKFIQVGGSTFEGLYKCSEVGLLNNFIVNLGKFLYGDGTEVATFDFSDIPFSDMTEMLNTTTGGLMMFVPLTWDDYILQGNTIHKVTSCWIFNDVSNVLIKNNNVAYMYSTSSSTEGGVITWNKDTGATKKTSSTMSSTTLTSKKSTLYADYELIDKYFFKVNLAIQEHKFILMTDTTFGCYCYDVDTFSSSVDDSSFTYKDFEQNYSEFKILKYLNAPSQLTLSASNQLLPNISAYGKNGVITGDGSISNNIVDLTRELFGNTESLSIRYLNVEPYKLETKKYSLCKSNECDVALGVTINGDVTSGWKIFYNNGVCSNYYFDGEYYYVANVTSDKLTMYKIDKCSKLINTYTINVSGLPGNTSTANNIGIGKYNNTWYLFFTNSASNSYTYFNYSYGTINLENSTYTNISSGTRTLYSGTVNISVMSTSISMAGNKIGIGAKLAYNTSNGGKFSYIGYLEYMNLDTNNVTTYMNNTTLVSNQNTSYIDGVKIVMTDRYLVYHARYYSSSASYKAYRLSVDMSSGTKVSSSDSSTVDIYYGSPNYIGNEYAWSFNNNNTKAIRIKLSDGSIDIINLPDIITGMDETNSYGITVGKIYRFSGDTYTIEENKQLLNNVSGWYFTRIVETDEYFANLGITANQFYWYSKIETGNSYDLVCQSRDNTVGCKSMLPYFTAPGFSSKLKNICYSN